MTDEQEEEQKKREFALKVVQAWADSRNKIATGVAVLNGAVLATTVTILKDKGEIEPYVTALHSSLFGITAAIFALALVWGLSEHVLGRIGKSESELHVRGVMSWFPSLLFIALIAASFMGFVASTAFFQGWTDASYEHAQIKKK